MFLFDDVIKVLLRRQVIRKMVLNIQYRIHWSLALFFYEVILDLSRRYTQKHLHVNDKNTLTISTNQDRHI